MGSNPTGSAKKITLKALIFRAFLLLWTAQIRGWQHFGNIRGSSRLIEGTRNRVQIVIEQVRVGVECHCRRCMTQHSLYSFDVASCANSQTSGGVPQIVESHGLKV